MRSTFLIAALVGLALSKGSPGSQSSIKKKAKLPLLDLRFFARMSFYTPSDEKASVIVNTALSQDKGIEVGDAFWTEYNNSRPVAYTVTDENSNEQLTDWVDFSLSTVNAELNFSLARFPPQEEAYRLHLWAVSQEGVSLFQSKTLLRVLSDDDGRTLARHDRLLEHLYGQASPSTDGQTNATLPTTSPTSASTSSSGVPHRVKGDPGVFTSMLPWQKNDSGVPKSILDLEDLTYNETWWQRILPANVYVTTWNIVSSKQGSGNLTHWFDKIKVAGYNVVHPTNGSGKSVVPFNADLILEFSSKAKDQGVHVLYDIDFRSPSGNFKEHHNIEYDDGTPKSHCKEPRATKKEPRLHVRTPKNLDKGYDKMLAAIVKAMYPLLDDEEVRQVVDAMRAEYTGMDRQHRAVFLRRLTATFVELFSDKDIPADLEPAGKKAIASARKNSNMLKTPELASDFLDFVSTEIDATFRSDVEEHEDLSTELPGLSQVRQQQAPPSVPEEQQQTQSSTPEQQQQASHADEQTQDDENRELLRTYLGRRAVLDGEGQFNVITNGKNWRKWSPEEQRDWLSRLIEENRADLGVKDDNWSEHFFASDTGYNRAVWALSQLKLSVHNWESVVPTDITDNSSSDWSSSDDEKYFRTSRQKWGAMDSRAKKAWLVAFVRKYRQSLKPTQDFYTELDGVGLDRYGRIAIEDTRVKRQYNTYDKLDIENSPALSRRDDPPPDSPLPTSPTSPEDATNTVWWDPEAGQTFTGPKPPASSPTDTVIKGDRIPTWRKEKIAWEAADSLRRILDEYFAPHGMNKQPNSVKMQIAWKSTETLRHVIDSYFGSNITKFADNQPTVRRRAMRDVVSEDAMNVVEGFKQTTGANASAVQDLEDTSDSSDFETARTTLSEQGKSDILSAFKRNLRNLLRRRADSRVGKPKKPKSRPSEFRIDPNDADWERTVMQQVHKDVMEAFEHKVKASIHDWFNIPDPQDQSSGQDKSFSQQHKTPNTDSGTSSDTDTDASSWKQIPHVADVPMGTITISPALTRSSTFSRKYPSPLNPSANVNEEEENEDDYWGPTAIPNVDPTSTTTSTTTITIARNYTRLRPYSSPLTTIPTLNEDADEYWGPTMSARDEAPQPTALYRRDHADYSDQVNTDDDSLTSDASDWERQILNNVHKDVMEAFADKNRAELWRQNHPDEPLPNYLRTKKPISNKGDQQLKGNPDLSYKPLTTDSSESSDWEGQLLDKVHKDVMEAFADKNRAKLWKQNHPGQPVPDWVLRTMKPMSNRRYQQLKGNLPVEPEHEIQDHRRVFSGLKTATSDPSPSSSPRRRSRKARRAASPTAPVPAPKRTLKALLQDSDTCVQDPECDIETADFVKGLDKKDSREQLLAWCRGFCERDPESCRAIGCDRYLYEYGDYVD